MHHGMSQWHVKFGHLGPNLCSCEQLRGRLRSKTCCLHILNKILLNIYIFKNNRRGKGANVRIKLHPVLASITAWKHRPRDSFSLCRLKSSSSGRFLSFSVVTEWSLRQTSGPWQTFSWPVWGCPSWVLRLRSLPIRRSPFNFVLQMVSCLLPPEFSSHHSACEMVPMLLTATQPQSSFNPLASLTAGQIFCHQILCPWLSKHAFTHWDQSASISAMWLISKMNQILFCKILMRLQKTFSSSICSIKAILV